MRGFITEQRVEFLKKLLEDELLVLAKASKKTLDDFKGQFPYIASNADIGNKFSIRVANGLAEKISVVTETPLKRIDAKKGGQSVGNLFEAACARFVKNTFLRLGHIRPGHWNVFHIPGNSNLRLGRYEQYSHLSELDRLSSKHKELKSFLGEGYTVSPDVVIDRVPEPDSTLNSEFLLVDEDSCDRAALREKNNMVDGEPTPLLHSSISCKFTMRSDRAQNTRTEALNLLRCRKGRAPHIVSVTAEPTPSRISSLALGTGDIDCVYHIALYELREVIEEMEDQDEALAMLDTMIEGKRLRDISDLPLDLAV